MADDLSIRIAAALRVAGAHTSPELQAITAASQASVSRALAPLLAAGTVLKVGAARKQAYVMPRAVEGVGTTVTVPIVKVAPDGSVAPFGTLVPVQGGRCWVEDFDSRKARLHDDIPWFVADMRPQGFLGRAFAHANAQLRLAANPDHWNSDDVLRALSQRGDDLPGNLVIGAEAFDRFMHAKPAERARPRDYAALAEAAMKGALPGSLAGGEQPKFCTVREDSGQPVIVKFSPAGKSAPELRWADLLVCEHLALTVLREAHLPAAKTRILHGGGRVMLEAERFDRTTAGRIGMVSLLAYDAEYIGQMDNWGAAAERMVTRNLMTAADGERLRLFEAYGRQIGNTDRHYGNVSLLANAQGQWTLAPAYDQLPMVYAPVAGEIVARDDFDPAALVPTAETVGVWAEARRLAALFWSRAAADKDISAGFRRLAARHARAFGKPAGRRADAEPTFQRTRPS